jgi:amidase
MADLSFPLDKPLSPLEMKRRLLRLNGKLHAVRKWKDPQADKAIHLLVKDNIGVTGFPTSAGSHAFKDCAGIPKSKSSAKPISRNWPAL